MDVLEILHLSWIWPRWIDLIWLPILLLMSHKGQRLSAVMFGAGNIVMMRMLIDLMDWFDVGEGVFGLLPVGLFLRGLIYFSVVHFLYLLYAFAVRKGAPAMFMTGTIMALMVAHGLFVLIMVL